MQISTFSDDIQQNRASHACTRGLLLLPGSSHTPTLNALPRLNRKCATPSLEPLLAASTTSASAAWHTTGRRATGACAHTSDSPVRKQGRSNGSYAPIAMPFRTHNSNCWCCCNERPLQLCAGPSEGHCLS
jgi:hypothetical protein